MNTEYWTRFCGNIIILPKIKKSLADKINSRFKKIKIYPKRSVLAFIAHKHCNHFEEIVKKVIDVYLLPRGYVCNGLIFAVGDNCYENHWAIKVVNSGVYRKDFIFKKNESEKVKLIFPSYSPISSDDCYEVRNGLIGMARNIIFRLIGMCNDRKIKIIVGISSGNLLWKRHVSFLMMRRREVRLMVNENKGFNIHGHSTIEERCRGASKAEMEEEKVHVTATTSITVQFDKERIRSGLPQTDWGAGETLFLDRKLVSGRFRMVVNLTCLDRTPAYGKFFPFSIGAAHADDAEGCMAARNILGTNTTVPSPPSYFHQQQPPQPRPLLRNCGFVVNEGVEYPGNITERRGNIWVNGCPQIPRRRNGWNVVEKRCPGAREGDSVAMEVDMDTDMMYFFVNSVQIPYRVVGLPTPLRVGISSDDKNVIRIILFQRVDPPTAVASPSPPPPPPASASASASLIAATATTAGSRTGRDIVWTKKEEEEKGEEEEEEEEEDEDGVERIETPEERHERRCAEGEAGATCLIM